MCLEFINHWVDSSLALWGLVVIALALAALAAVAMLIPSRRRPRDRQPISFTCPCYTPPYAPMNRKSD